MLIVMDTHPLWGQAPLLDIDAVIAVLVVVGGLSDVTAAERRPRDQVIDPSRYRGNWQRQGGKRGSDHPYRSAGKEDTFLIRILAELQHEIPAIV